VAVGINPKEKFELVQFFADPFLNFLQINIAALYRIWGATRFLVPG
jgi:hypothetical protein